MKDSNTVVGSSALCCHKPSMVLKNSAFQKAVKICRSAPCEDAPHATFELLVSLSHPPVLTLSGD